QPAAAGRLFQARRDHQLPDVVRQREHALVSLAVVEAQLLQLSLLDATVDLVGGERLRIELVGAHRHGPERPVQRDVHRVDAHDAEHAVQALGELGHALRLHLGSPVAQPQRVAELAQRLNSVFRIVRVYTMYIPLYGSLWSMAVCSDKLDPKAFTADEIDRRIEQRKLQELRFYNGETHEGVFALPNYVRELVIPARLKQPARGRRL